MQERRSHFDYEDLLACARGELFAKGPQLPLPPMLMFDRISEIAEVGGEYGKGLVRAVLELKPDLVLGFSDLQAGIAAELVRAGLEVHIFNHRSVADILRMIRTLGGMIGCEVGARALADELEAGLGQVRARAAALARRPRVYFEEWDDPLISGIGWVSELVTLAGGEDCFPELAREPLGRDRIIADPLEVPRRAPDIVLGSWCGKKFRPQKVASRPGWAEVPAVRAGYLREIKSSIILQPGPAALTDGVRAIQQVIEEWAARPQR